MKSPNPLALFEPSTPFGGYLPFWSFLALVFLGSILWSHSRDPFRRTEFSVKTAAGTKVHGITVLPVGFRNGPVIVYAHGSGGNLMTDGNHLRQFAKLGMAAVGFDYDQSNPGVFDGQFSAVLDYTRRQSWADTHAIAWVGFSLGAQKTLAYLLKHTELQPQVYVHLSGGWMPESNRMNGVTVLLIHGENDQVFPVEDAKRLAGWLHANGTAATLRVLPGHGHDFEADQPVVFRLISEYCKAKLTPGYPQPEFPKLRTHSFLLCVAPAFVWLGLWICWRRKKKGDCIGETSTVATETVALPLTKWECALRGAAMVLGILAAADTALHQIPPTMVVSPRTLAIARKYLLAPQWHRDFETLATMAIWQGQRLQTLLTDVELSHYTMNELVNWKIEYPLYRQYVLSPVIVGGESELNWRRELWENFYPRVRHEITTSDAAENVVRFLREEVTIDADCPKRPGAESMWKTHIVNLEDFEILKVAALRSVSIPARLTPAGEAEFWTGAMWTFAPPPLAITWVE